MEKRHQAAKLIIGAVVIIVAILALAGIVAGRHIMYKPAPLSREDIDYEALKAVKAPEATNRDGVISANDWATVSNVYKHIADSMLAKGDYQINAEDYLKEDPYLVKLYAGYGFAVDYKAARGHEFTMQDVLETGRTNIEGKPQKANCLTCKTPNFTKLIEATNGSAYGEDFKTVHAQITAEGAESVSCYTCHGNTPNEWHVVDPNAKESTETNLTVTHTYVTDALGDNMKKIDPGVLACGQCHIEYHFDSDAKTTMPYHSVEEMTPEAIYSYYQHLGFKDWAHKTTGANMLKVQHPEMETYLYGKHAGSLSCADCHMPVVQDEKDHTIYHSHTLVSPLNDASLLASCAQCHGDTDMVQYVKNIQTRISDEEKRIGGKLEAYTNELAEAVTANKLSEPVLNELREIQREAQWFFDFCYVENSEGAHNSDLSMHCLDTAEKLVDRGAKELELANLLILLSEQIETGAVQPDVLNKACELHDKAQKSFDLCYGKDAPNIYSTEVSDLCVKETEAFLKEALALFPQTEPKQ